jgi:predicted nucleic acid-binding protein
MALKLALDANRYIAALVMQHDLVLFSRDKHFECLPQIPRL